MPVKHIRGVDLAYEVVGDADRGSCSPPAGGAASARSERSAR